MSESKTTPVDSLIAPAARDALCGAIAECGGDEVFFVGRVNSDAVVESVEACAYGNQDAVPVIERQVRPGNVVIHNHPGGDLRPSQEDIEVASRFGNLGVGSYVVDNAVERLRVIVPAMLPKERRALDVERLEKTLAPGGRLARSMGRRYEDRPQQVRMLRQVADALNDDGIAVIEAGTGTGKSLAYLLPLLYWAKTNGEKVVVSTNTINLQEQLIGKDIPFLQKHLGLEFTAELMKGRGNYLCRRRAQQLVATPDMFGEPELESQVRAIVEWAAKTETGSLSHLGFVPDPEAWEQVACDADNCARVKCEHYAKCFFFEARRRAARADLIVANHHLVMADMAVRMESNNYSSTAVLPPYDRIVFDEAHNVENVATQYFGLRLTRRTLSRLLNRLVHRDRRQFGLLPLVHSLLRNVAFHLPTESTIQAAERIPSELVPLRFALGEEVEELMDACAQGVADFSGGPIPAGKEEQMRITPEVEDGRFWTRTLREEVDRVVESMQQLVQGLRQVQSAVRKVPEGKRSDLEGPAGELGSIVHKMSHRIDEFRKFYSVSQNQCRWIEVYRPHDKTASCHVRLFSLPLEVQGDLNEAVYSRAKTIVMTSATLTVDRAFDFFVGRVGLSAEHCESDTLERVRALQLDTPFNFDRQAFVGVPIDVPDPADREFDPAACDFLLHALRISRGSAFVLFTSYRQLKAFHERLEPVLRGMGYTCLRQGSESRAVLLERFKNDRTSILFATSSFWEGVDVPGDALRLLVLVKLPFQVPTDPLFRARVERLDAMGVDSFMQYTVPQAVIKFKQGFGRLIRTREDYGAVLILDRRVVTKRYGQVFLGSLPSETIHRKPASEILDDMETFFADVTARRTEYAGGSGAGSPEKRDVHRGKERIADANSDSPCDAPEREE
ncbi:DEAD/DEAH box helicase family protein [Candidatus Sumerlaeota bacterium]|nr:DEAD/DEAH box helicase family protein [Candidatus Sumerlaeota bacterium]